MPESEARKRWVKENKQFYGFKLHKKNDEDIIKYLEGKQYATVVKLALREYISQHEQEEQNDGIIFSNGGIPAVHSSESPDIQAATGEAEAGTAEAETASASSES